MIRRRTTVWAGASEFWEKRCAVDALRGLNLRGLAAGDSYNDTTMLSEADAGILFRPPDNVVEEFPQFPVARTYEAGVGRSDLAAPIPPDRLTPGDHELEVFVIEGAGVSGFASVVVVVVVVVVGSPAGAVSPWPTSEHEVARITRTRSELFRRTASQATAG